MYANVGEISFAICSGQTNLTSIAIGWTADKWRYVVRIYEAGRCIYSYWAGNSRHDSGQTVALNRGLKIGEMREYAQRTAEEMAKELGLEPDCVFEEEN